MESKKKRNNYYLDAVFIDFLVMNNYAVIIERTTAYPFYKNQNLIYGCSYHLITYG